VKKDLENVNRSLHENGDWNTCEDEGCDEEQVALKAPGVLPRCNGMLLSL
jgi:hypothetical protein